MFVTRAPLYKREFSLRVKLSTHSPAGVVGVDVDAAAVVVVVAGVVVVVADKTLKTHKQRKTVLKNTLT